MSEQQKAPVEPTATEQSSSQPTDSEVIKLRAEIEAMRRKNTELLTEYKTVSSKIKNVPDDVNVQDLIDFKHNAEQSDLENKGKYTEAKQALEGQFREKTAEKDNRIAELESKLRELELVSPAVSALADLVHDPNLVLKNYLKTEQIEIGEGGIPVVVDGYERTPISEWAKQKLPSFQLKEPKPTGSGAPVARAGTSEFSQDMLKPFLPETANITEQGRILRVHGKETWTKLREIAAKR